MYVYFLLFFCHFSKFCKVLEPEACEMRCGWEVAVSHVASRALVHLTLTAVVIDSASVSTYLVLVKYYLGLSTG